MESNLKFWNKPRLTTVTSLSRWLIKDEVNMISAVLAKQMGAKETVVLVRNPEYSNAYFKEQNFLDSHW